VPDGAHVRGGSVAAPVPFDRVARASAHTTSSAQTWATAQKSAASSSNSASMPGSDQSSDQDHGEGAGAQYPGLAHASAGATRAWKILFVLGRRCVNGFMERIVQFDSGEIWERRFSQFPPRFAAMIGRSSMTHSRPVRMPQNAAMPPPSPCRA